MQPVNLKRRSSPAAGATETARIWRAGRVFSGRLEL